jgi:periplasmic protein TonB
MTTLAHPRLPELDDPWRRLPWLAPLALAAWMLLLVAFSLLLQQTAPPPAELKPVEARIVEVPVGGLAGGGGAGAVPIAKPRPAPIVRPKPVAKVHPKKIEAPPVVPASPEGTLKGKETESAGPPSAGTGAATSGEATGGGAGSGTGEGGGGSGGGLGSDSVGARAIYAPVPNIPDDLREQIFQAEAVAQFTVSYDGTVKVTLIKPTPNPRLNQILLDTLQQWKFFPAVKGGVAIDSIFQLKIPISVQ